MISNKIKICNISEEEKADLDLILKCGDIEFVQNYLKEIEMKSTAVKNLPTMEICKLHEMGWSVKKIAEKYDCTPNSITKHLAKGGYYWNPYKAKWIKKSTDTNVAKKNRQREVINWLLNNRNALISSGGILTIEMISKEFDVSTSTASGYMTSIVEKNIMGIKKVGRGVYEISKDNHSIPSIENTSAIQVTTKPEIKEQSGKALSDLASELIQIGDFAEKVGGLKQLIAKVEYLIQFKNMMK